jgi:single-stranded DNA-binding protein
MNQVILDGCVQKNVNLLSEISSFNLSAITGEFTLPNNKKKNRFTYIRVVYPRDIDEYLESVVQPNNMVRVYGKIDSEQYETESGKTVYNKILCAEKVVKIRFNKDTQQYEEVI